MKRKIISIFIITLFISTAIPIMGFQLLEPELDQYNTEYSWVFDGLIMPGGWAQSFKPTMNKLSRVELKIDRSGLVGWLNISIRKILIDKDLATFNMHPWFIPSGINWLTFDFDDIKVTPGETYYIIVDSDICGLDNNYKWSGTDTNPYDRGHACIYDPLVDTWNERSSIDFCFKTYGIKGLAKSVDINPPFLQFLDDHPNLFPILRQILGL
jgi:hypothetical protein